MGAHGNCQGSAACGVRPGCDTADMDIQLEADLHDEDDHRNNWTLLDPSAFDPSVVFPGAVLQAGRPGAASEAQVLRTELFLGDSSIVRVLVTFRQTSLR